MPRSVQPHSVSKRAAHLGGQCSMEIGVFVPINNNGWLISENAPQYMPSFDHNKEIAQLS